MRPAAPIAGALGLILVVTALLVGRRFETDITRASARVAHGRLLAVTRCGRALWHSLVDFRQNFNVQAITWLLEFALLYMASLTAYRLEHNRCR